ncbi:hypothetical protein PR202_gb09202 [Eleusine coracana subsp. coracana]|uniref:Uncharacterized protein n=1 Tax=Eleusine coracana subsp. coracana TaxID=191504 RepID=A0AAV5EEZ8_ELECO|nr:hypothetical protein PR202_gb09202 [Eleusine coracana subsp. coracana]
MFLRYTMIRKYHNHSSKDNDDAKEVLVISKGNRVFSACKSRKIIRRTPPRSRTLSTRSVVVGSRSRARRGHTPGRGETEEGPRRPPEAMALGARAAPFTYVAHALAVVAAVMVLVWCIQFRGGLAFENTNKNLIFNYAYAGQHKQPMAI